MFWHYAKKTIYFGSPTPKDNNTSTTAYSPMNSNTGFIEKLPGARDFVAGDISAISPIPVTNGDWTKWLPTDERQAFRFFDTMACVTFSALNSIETYLNWLIDTKKLTPEQVGFLTSGYLDSNGKVNLSDRFTAKMSGTQKNGNYLISVADSIRNHGVLPESDWQGSDTFEWDTYYAEIPQALKDKAKKFTEYFEVMYEWINPTPGENLFNRIKQELTVSPIQIAAPTCPPWGGTAPIPPCGKTAASHATMIYSTSDSIKDLDHYDPYKKLLTPDYTIPYLFRYVVLPRAKQPVKDSILLKSLEGKYVQRVQDLGQVYKVVNGKLEFLSSDKQPDKHIPLVDAAIKELNSLGKLVGITEETYNKIK